MLKDHVNLGCYEVAGVAYRTTANFLYRVDELDELELEREPENRHDPNAIKVVYTKDGQRSHLGYVPAVSAKMLAPLMDAGLKARASVDECVPTKPLLTMIIYVPKTL